jgi:Flp pilus assembly protein TadG
MRLLRSASRKSSYFYNCTRAGAAVELAIITPVLLLMGIGIFDFGEAIYVKTEVQKAAQVGAQYALVHGFDAASLSKAVTAATTVTGVSATPSPNQFCGCATSTGVSEVDCKSKCSGGIAPGTYVTVSAIGSYQAMISYPLMPKSFSFSAQSTVRIQ